MNMKVVIAIDSFKGSMTSMEAGHAAEEGIRAVCPDAEVVIRPLADGGEGTVDALVEGLGGEYVTARVKGPMGSFVTARYGIMDDEKTAIMEMDQAGFREFLPIHVDYGTYEVDPIYSEISEGLSPDDFKTLFSMNAAMDLDYSNRLYAKYGTLPSLDDESIDLPEEELRYYRHLVANFKKFSPYLK